MLLMKDEHGKYFLHGIKWKNLVKVEGLEKNISHIHILWGSWETVILTYLCQLLHVSMFLDPILLGLAPIMLLHMHQISFKHFSSYHSITHCFCRSSTYSCCRSCPWSSTLCNYWWFEWTNTLVRSSVSRKFFPSIVV